MFAKYICCLFQHFVPQDLYASKWFFNVVKEDVADLLQLTQIVRVGIRAITSARTSELGSTKRTWVATLPQPVQNLHPISSCRDLIWLCSCLMNYRKQSDVQFVHSKSQKSIVQEI
jgi:hypothetical protein